MIHHVLDGHNFKNAFLFYRFRSDEEASTKGPSSKSLLQGCGIGKHGPILKRGLLFWSDRYAILREDEKTLYIFRTENESSPIEVFNLAEFDLTVKETGQCKEGFYCFVIKSKDSKKKLQLIGCTKKSKDQEEWIDALSRAGIKFQEEALEVSATSLFEFSAKSIDMEEILLSKFKGNVCLVVNVASQ
eukprot:TRINITY_DN1097_c0_g5_i1.p1 TRINITY_DN1097_c0_g5~~TRINITY_DN1097_c0_g5_i1.p1  ORF type:complete len:188 (-),score=8.96 TRINITY_DN1097_c0_g5_i1:614-1177(-)